MQKLDNKGSFAGTVPFCKKTHFADDEYEYVSRFTGRGSHASLFPEYICFDKSEFKPLKSGECFPMHLVSGSSMAVAVNVCARMPVITDHATLHTLSESTVLDGGPHYYSGSLSFHLQLEHVYSAEPGETSVLNTSWRDLLLLAARWGERSILVASFPDGGHAYTLQIDTEGLSMCEAVTSVRRQNEALHEMRICTV